MNDSARMIISVVVFTIRTRTVESDAGKCMLKQATESQGYATKYTAWGRGCLIRAVVHGSCIFKVVIVHPS
jgi:hypothetical protein